MPTLYTITGRLLLPDGSTADTGEVKLSMLGGWSVDAPDVRVNQQTYSVLQDGTVDQLATVGLPAGTYDAYYRSSNGGTRLHFSFTLSASVAWSDLIMGPGVVIPTDDAVAAARGYRDEAQTSATNAATSATNAANSAAAAGSSQTAAAGSASAAATSEINAKTSETNAANSASQAAQSASDASATLAGALTKTDNLASLADKPTARTNLGLGDAATHPAADFASAAQGVKADTALQPTLADAKGDLFVGTGDNVLSRLPVGANGAQVFADSSTTTGLRFGASGEWGNETLLPNAIDLNTVVRPGLYRVYSSALNLPVVNLGGHLLVSTQDTGVTSMQQFTIASTQRMFFRSLNNGGTWLGWTEICTNSPQPGNTMIGTGSPQGIVAAPVGTKYVDTAVTLGAVEWTKMSGSGNTGWAVSVGDTGLRPVTSGLLNGWAATQYVEIQRVGPRVQINFELLDPTNATSDICYTLPAGFRPPHARRNIVGNDAMSNRYTLYIESTGNVRILQYSKTSGVISGSIAYFTQDNWPTTLP